MASKVQGTPSSKPTAAVIANYFNNNFDRMNIDKKFYSTKGKKSGKDIVIPSSIQFKITRKDETNGIVIDINDYKGLQELQGVLQDMPNAAPSTHADVITDPMISNYLRILSAYPKDKRGITIERLMNNFDVKEQQQMSMVDAINSIAEFMSNKEKLHTKIFNVVFPHDTHKHGVNDLPKGVNIIYLQHMSKYHQKIMDMLILDGAAEREILEEVRDAFIEEGGYDDSASIHLFNPNIIDNIISPPSTVNKKGNEVVDLKWINKLQQCETYDTKTGSVTYSEDLVDDETVAIIKLLVKEYGYARALIKQIEGASNARELVIEHTTVKAEGGGSKIDKIQTSKPIVVDLKKCLSEFKTACAEFDKFHDLWMKDIKSKLNDIESNYDHLKDTAPEGKDPEGYAEDEQKRQRTIVFISYFINAAKLIIKLLGVSDPIKTLTKNTTIKFSPALRENLKKLIATENPPPKDIHEVATKFYTSWAPQIVPTSYEIDNLDVYSKIGATCGFELNKDYRIAVGIAIVNYILTELRVILASNIGKSTLKINFKV